jgi:nicotinate-nucleotide pyrophosphorylase (carboxylating)
MNYIGLDNFILEALREDIGTGDITTNCCIPEDAVSSGTFKAKQDGIFCGADVLTRVFYLVDPTVSVTLCVKDGDPVTKGQAIATITGASRSVLSSERVALNLIQHMSGIATAAHKAVETVSGTGTIIVDTRKTMPGLRVLEKYAVKAGGANNHRYNLADGVLIKDNHIVAAGGIANAINAVRRNAPHTLKIEIETETLDQVQQALDAGADIIMLDNMSIEQMSEAVKLIGSRALTEASGNMGERDLREVAETGVNYISIGALTHSVVALDISLKFE